MQPDRTGWLTYQEQLDKGRKNGQKAIHKARKLAYKLRRLAKNGTRTRPNQYSLS